MPYLAVNATAKRCDRFGQFSSQAGSVLSFLSGSLPESKIACRHLICEPNTIICTEVLEAIAEHSLTFNISRDGSRRCPDKGQIAGRCTFRIRASRPGYLKAARPAFDKSGRADGTFERADFTYNAENDANICPGGNELKQYRRGFTKPMKPKPYADGERISRSRHPKGRPY